MNKWVREGWYYRVVVKHDPPIDEGNGYFTVLTIRSLGFISYHLIKWYHGEKGLEEMANK